MLIFGHRKIARTITGLLLLWIIKLHAASDIPACGKLQYLALLSFAWSIIAVAIIYSAYQTALSKAWVKMPIRLSRSCPLNGRLTYIEQKQH
jgi:putative effector of murein hydrolase LrgA (UPF0299 family)